MSSILFCNNCGKLGHSYQKCRKPILSLGIIVIRFKPKIQYLLVQRRNTLGYVDFIRGKYSLTSTNYIQELFNLMTNKEIREIKTKTFNVLWKELWLENEYQYRNEYNNSEIKFNEIMNGYTKDNTLFSIDKFINSRVTKWDEAEWGFPKGRRNNNESDFKCAIREWVEETGYNKHNIQIINNILPYSELFLGTNNKAYKYKYYIGIMKETIPISFNYEKSEINKVEWYTYEECMNLFRSYNHEKKELLTRLNNILKNSIIY